MAGSTSPKSSSSDIQAGILLVESSTEHRDRSSNIVTRRRSSPIRSSLRQTELHSHRSRSSGITYIAHRYIAIRGFRPNYRIHRARLVQHSSRNSSIEFHRFVHHRQQLHSSEHLATPIYRGCSIPDAHLPSFANPENASRCT